MLAGVIGTAEWVVIAIVALVIFGRNLPSVARNLGSSIVEFKKGLKEAENAGEPEKLPGKEDDKIG